MEAIEKILNDFATEKIPVILKNYSLEEYDQILDKRDLDSFSNKWMNVYESINAQIENNHFSDGLRERVFKILLSNMEIFTHFEIPNCCFFSTFLFCKQ